MKKIIIALIILITVNITFLGLYVAKYVQENLKLKSDTREEIMYVYNALSPGMTKDDVMKVFETKKFEHITLVDTHDPKRWQVGSDMYFFVQLNWILIFDFSESGILEEIMVSTWDGQPPGVPPTKFLNAPKVLTSY